MSPAYIFLFIAFLLSAIMGMIIIPRILFLSHKHKLYDIQHSFEISIISQIIVIGLKKNELLNLDKNLQ